jgi:drug/metabolite transporter (DMT)-like permease
MIASERSLNPRRDHLVRTYAAVALFIALKAVGNLSLAWGMKHSPGRPSANPLHYLLAMLDPAVALGVGLLILSVLARMALLSIADLTFVLPVTAIGYVLAAFLGKTFLHEVVTPQRWAGTVLIVIGAALVGSTSESTTGENA